MASLNAVYKSIIKNKLTKYNTYGTEEQHGFHKGKSCATYSPP
jgi:hypothetical protein